MHSKHVRYSSQVGVDVFVETSYRDLQSVTMDARGALANISSGSITFAPGFFNHSHNKRSQDILSRQELNATASVDRVDLTTFAIFFELHTTGQTTPTRFSAKFPSVTKTMVPCRELLSRFVAKEASLKVQNVSSSIGIGTKCRHTGFVFASCKILFNVKPSPTVARVTRD